MNAMQTRKQPQTIDRSRQKTRPKRRKSSHRGAAVETILKLACNGILCIAGVAAISKLLPHHFLQEAKLREVKTEVRETKQRVDRLSQELSRNTDVQQTSNLRQQYSHKVSPDRRPIIWLENKSKQ